jgi:hypothetical protein
MQVTRFMAAASSSFESLPLSTITQGVMLEVRWGSQQYTVYTLCCTRVLSCAEV